MASRGVGGTLRAALGTLLLLLVLLPAVCSGQVTLGFEEGSEYVEIPEEQPVGTLIIDFSATYVDNFGIPQDESSGSYNFSDPTAADVDKFSLNTATGQIRNAMMLDRDAPGAQTSFRLAVTFSTTNNLTATTTVQVALLDVNDNPPRFTQDLYEALTAENTAPGDAFFHVTAVDPDQVQREQVIDEEAENFGGFVYVVSNGRVVYSIVGGNELGHFAIHPDTGNLTVATGESLDVDVIDFYNITVLAEDGGGLNDTAIVFIRVLDSNDNPPQIHSPLSVEITISEDTAPGYVVINSINATDADSGLNADIEFLILSGDSTGSFSIDSTTGELSVSSSLDREAAPDATISLTISARDHGVPPLQATIPVTVHLLDINDSPPRFDQSSYTFSVSESARIGDLVGQVAATDLDAEENGTVTYSLVNLTSPMFAIDPSTGAITTNTTLDREETPFYYLTVEAIDNPNNNSFQLSSTVNVSVAVADVNDNSPVWLQSLYTAGVLDNEALGLEVIRLQATDEDSGTNGEIRYEFFGATDSDFAIDLTTGSVTVNTNLNFGTKSTYQYRVRASDTAAVPRDAFTELNITVHTPNINPPMFEFPSYSVSVNEVLPIGSTALNVTATDSDPGLIGEVHYRIAPESVFDGAGSFNIDPNTGAVMVSSSLDFEFR